jgi:hypothetical protein
LDKDCGWVNIPVDILLRFREIHFQKLLGSSLVKVADNVAASVTLFSLETSKITVDAIGFRAVFWVGAAFELLALPAVVFTLGHMVFTLSVHLGRLVNDMWNTGLMAVLDRDIDNSDPATVDVLALADVLFENYEDPILQH